MLQRLILANLDLVRTMDIARLAETDSLATVRGVSMERDARVSTGLHELIHVPCASKILTLLQV